MDRKLELAKALDVYIKEKHTQDECIGFIAGFEQATDLVKLFVIADVINCPLCGGEMAFVHPKTV